VKQFIIILFSLFSIHLSAQSEAGFFNAMKNLDVAEMNNYLEDKIDFCIFEDQQIMNKKDALLKLKNFLASNKIIDIEVMHKGASKDKSSQYKVAKITTQKETFRVFVYTSGGISTKTIKEIRIDKF
jgi:hypothetical protein